MSDVSQIDASSAAAVSPVCGKTCPWTTFLTAVSFLTRIPVAGLQPPEVLARCPAYFPLVGIIIGLGSSAVLASACLLWPAWLAVVIAVAVEAWLTGALHEDALADFCDAFGGGWDREQTLTILRDSRIGTFGATGLGLVVTLRVGALTLILQQAGLANWLWWAPAVVAAAAVGRWVMVLVMALLPVIPRREGLAQSMGGRLTSRELLLATAWALPAAALFAACDPLGALLSLLLLTAAVLWFLRLVRRRLGGTTGDCAGCIGYVANTLILLSAAAQVGAATL